MWQRFTERARKVVFYAQEEAQKFGEGYVSTEHLLLGLCHESDSVAARVLEKLHISLAKIRAEIERQLPKGEPRPSPDMSLTPRGKRVIDIAYDEARSLGDNYIGTEHLLLGLIREGDGLAGRVLAKLGAELDQARMAVVELHDADPSRESSSTKSMGELARSRTLTRAVETKSPLVRYTKTLRKAIFRAFEVEQDHGYSEVRPDTLLAAFLVDDECLASKALKEVNADLDSIVNFLLVPLPKMDSICNPYVEVGIQVKEFIGAAWKALPPPRTKPVDTGHILTQFLLSETSTAGRVLAHHKVNSLSIDDYLMKLRAGDESLEK